MEQIEYSGRWPDDWTAQIGRAIARQRKRRRLSAAKLSEKCAEQGFAIPRTTITNLENGRKASIPVHELFVLARALDASPQDLLFPAATDATVLGPDGREEDIVEVALWFADTRSDSPAELPLYFDHWWRVGAVQAADEGHLDRLDAEVFALGALRGRIKDRGLRMPDLPARVAQLLEDLSRWVPSRG